MEQSSMSITTEAPPPESASLTVKELPNQSSHLPAPTTAPSTAHSTIQHHLRSCITCRRRKVRCNKNHPCSNCVKANTECVFPGPGRAPRKSKKQPDNELLARLRRLEGMVQNLGAQATDDGHLSLEPALSSEAGETKETQKHPKELWNKIKRDFIENSDPRNLVQRDVEHEFGRLVIGDGRSRYVSNRFWAKLGDEVEEMRDILYATSSDGEDYSSPENQGSSSTQAQSHDGFLFGFTSLEQSLHELHPGPDQIPILWEMYVENVAPLVTIFHKPTLRKCFFRASEHLDSLNKNTEAVMFSVYYAAVTGMTASQCSSLLGEERQIMLSRYRAAMEHAMARANLLNSQSVVLLQAVVLYLICVRRQDETRYVWSMVAIVVRMAQGIGVHRDGSTFKLQPFETEMRRRIWWHICLLDFQAAEDHGCDPFIHEAFYDTRIPLNINDDDISQDSKETPEEREGCTDLTFTLIRCEVTVTAKRLNYIAPSPACPKADFSLSIEQREKLVEDLNKRLEDRYVQHCNMTVPILWTCATVSRLAVSRLWLTIHQPMSGLECNEATVVNDKHKRLFLTSIEVLEFSCLLETNENTMKWSWLFRTHMQWHAVAFTLSELCVRPPCPGVDRAWQAINTVYEIWDLQEKRGTVWRAINKLKARAVRFRENQLRELEVEFGGESGLSINGRTPSSMNDPIRLQPEVGSQYMSPALQAQNGIGRDFILPLEVTPQISETSYDPPGIVTTAAPFGQNTQQYPVTSVPFFPGSDVGASGWIHLGPQENNQTGFAPNLADLSSTQEPSWDDWDQVVREFQMDIAQGVETNNDHDMDWFE
ncbi:hypothetical protein AJ79_00820 [Helicocarpus griseus UAMH5409]|uniref:C6 finger domain transcription factor nscR n=1 Tax=Helicocarpus griseus UAMH5409 TaxID=1447875 RepID=A0A2B7YA38_9EURO|nr:hypothetical protein AJ79_00820 [Helicocarpus griseus UAMH5409]